MKSHLYSVHTSDWMNSILLLGITPRMISVFSTVIAEQTQYSRSIHSQNKLFRCQKFYLCYFIDSFHFVFYTLTDHVSGFFFLFHGTLDNVQLPAIYHIRVTLGPGSLWHVNKNAREKYKTQETVIASTQSLSSKLKNIEFIQMNNSKRSRTCQPLLS